jgi:hypothetical protein
MPKKVITLGEIMLRLSTLQVLNAVLAFIHFLHQLYQQLNIRIVTVFESTKSNWTTSPMAL